jgi:SAM-dependent methyltransferase
VVVDWKHGYFAEGGYTYGFYGEMAPARIAWLAALKGYRLPRRRFRYLDLGCGQGVHLALLAALHPEAEFVGIDFMPGHIAHARQLAAAAGLTNLRVAEADFLDLAADLAAVRADWGTFEIVAAHGISTWVAPPVREALFALGAGLLEPGGFFYNSYNCYPGWLDAVPFQHLVRQLQRQQGGMAALATARQLMGALQTAGSGLFAHQPSLALRLQTFAQQNPAYLAQEYNNHFWQPAHASEMIALAQRHKLEFVASATIPENLDRCYSSEVQALLAQQPDVLLRETVRDLALCQSFRRDLYAKGGAPLWPAELGDQLQQWRFVAAGLVPLPAADQPFAFTTPAMAINGERQAHLQVLEAFGVEGASVAEAAARLGQQNPAQLLPMVALLVHGGWLALAGPQPEQAGEQEQPVQRLNRALLAGALAGAPYVGWRWPGPARPCAFPIPTCCCWRCCSRRAIRRPCRRHWCRRWPASRNTSAKAGSGSAMGRRSRPAPRPRWRTSWPSACPATGKWSWCDPHRPVQRR